MTEPLAERLKAALSGRYAIERQLGQGAMAIVFLAQDVRHDRKVALVSGRSYTVWVYHWFGDANGGAHFPVGSATFER